MIRGPDKNAKAFADYIASKKIVIADGSKTSRASLASVMINLGAKMTNIVLASDYETAEDEIRRHKPHVVICDFDLGKRCGLELLQSQRSERPEEPKDRLFVLVTGNTSQSAVAQAAEEDVDCFILKPFTVGVLRSTILKAAIAKLQPDEYHATIDQGKTLLFEGKPDEATQLFKKAMELDPKPSLACFYRGQANLMKQALDRAEGSYQEGLAYNKIHYKCMVGLFELLMSRKMHEDAYELVKRISRYFPANPARLATVLRLAILTQSYDDIERYYQLFTNIERRDENLIKHICAALVVCGKYYLKNNFGSRAIELFQKAATSASGRMKILREIILVLLEFDLPKEAESFLTRFPPESQSGPDFLTMELIVLDRLQPSPLTVDQGRALLAKGVEDPLIYLVLIRRLRQHAQENAAESLAHQAAKKWPDRTESFLKALRGEDGRAGAPAAGAASGDGGAAASGEGKGPAKAG